MRGRVDAQGVMFHAFHIEDFVPANHPFGRSRSGPTGF